MRPIIVRRLLGAAIVILAVDTAAADLSQALFRAVEKGDAAAVDALLRQGAPIEAQRGAASPRSWSRRISGRRPSCACCWTGAPT